MSIHWRMKSLWRHTSSLWRHNSSSRCHDGHDILCLWYHIFCDRQMSLWQDCTSWRHHTLYRSGFRKPKGGRSRSSNSSLIIEIIPAKTGAEALVPSVTCVSLLSISSEFSVRFRRNFCENSPWTVVSSVFWLIDQIIVPADHNIGVPLEISEKILRAKNRSPSLYDRKRRREGQSFRFDFGTNFLRLFSGILVYSKFDWNRRPRWYSRQSVQTQLPDLFLDPEISLKFLLYRIFGKSHLVDNFAIFPRKLCTSDTKNFWKSVQKEREKIKKNRTVHSKNIEKKLSHYNDIPSYVRTVSRKNRSENFSIFLFKLISYFCHSHEISPKFLTRKVPLVHARIN